MSNVHSVSFSSVSVGAFVKDIFDITGSTLSNYRLLEVGLGVIAAALSSSAIETLAVGIYRGSTLSASGSATGTWELIAPVNVDAMSEATALFTARINSSSPGSSGPNQPTSPAPGSGRIHQGFS